MDDNMSTRSSESSITTSGEYEIVTDSNVATPLKAPPAQTVSAASELLVLHAAGSKSPTLAIANNRNISDLQHEMTDALRELELEKEWNALAVSGSQTATATVASSVIARSTTATTTPTIKAATTLIKQKSLTLPLASTSSPALIVPDDSDEDEERSGTASDRAAATGTVMSTMKAKSFNRRRRSVAGDQMQSAMPAALTPTPKSEEAYSSEHQRVGQSVFYDCIDASPAASGVDDHHGEFKPEKNDTDDEVSEIDQGCTIFSGVTYLGAAKINAPKSELDIYRIMSELNSGSAAAVGLKISISIPNCSDGLVVLYDAKSNTVIATYEIQSIILYFRGPVETFEHGCFAFTWLLGESLFQCHVFRCQIPEAVNQVSACFQKAFLTYPPSMTCSLTSAMDSNMINSVTSDQSGNPLSIAGYEFIVSLEIREKVAKNSYSAVPRDRNCFKLRAHTDKEVCITVKQTPSTVLQPLLIERCFGVLLSPGKLVRQADMQLIEMVCMGYKQPTTGGASGEGAATGATANTANAVPAVTPLCLNPYYIRAEWKASDKAFELLNVESSKTYLTVAVNIVMRGIKEPVRFVIETPVTIQSQGELRIMDHFISKRPMTLRFYLHLKRATDEFSWEVSSIDPSEEIVEPATTSSSSSYLLKFGMNNLSRIVRSSSIVSIEDECHTDYSSDGDEPLLSGTGEVSKDCSQDTLDEWDPILKEWDGEKRPKNLAALVRLGVPEALREKVWQKLANVDGKVEMNDMYKTLIIKDTKCETVIQRDIHRTFPAHKCFKENGGSGQDALFKVSKAYAVYDSEVGYCQGLSFIAASLLLHMPEEDAFCVLVALMYDFKLREMYKHGFEVLYLRLYQLDHLIKDQLPKLHEHFTTCGIETHMYASQWFLTLFTARFPLCFVFHVLDVFLLDGVPLLFQVALTLLGICEADLRQLDFEGILKYFRVTLPKKCRSSSQARRIMKMACERKIKKLKHYEEEFLMKKQHKERLEKETQVYEKRFGLEKRKLQAEVDTLQQQLSSANERAVDKETKHTGIIHDYKLIIQRLEHDMVTLNETLATVMSTVSKCRTCAHEIDIAGRGATQESSDGLGRGDQVSSRNGGVCVVGSDHAPLGPLDPLNAAMQRIRELEMELAQAKLAQVEAECKNQDLNHQLSTTLNEMATNRNSWQPWLSKTFNSLQEKVSSNRSGRDAPAATFQSYMSQQLNSAPSPTDSETNSPSSNQEFKAFALNSGSPKFYSKFQQTGKLRNRIDSLRNVVAPLDTATVGPASATAVASTTAVRPVPAGIHHEQSQPQAHP